MAETYADAAEVLIASGEPGRHQFDEPALHLAEQALELALKGFLRASGRRPDELKAYGHRLPDLLEGCRSCGLDETLLRDPDIIRVVETLVDVGTSGHGFRYPCNAANRWIEPGLALIVVRRILVVTKECCTFDRMLSAPSEPTAASD